MICHYILHMNQLCKVCGEPAAGFHFGAFTCEGCKSFFGRTYNNIGSISECKNNGECVINKKNRTACKACRLRKCLLVGMSKSGSRYGRRSNWFKIHCLLQEQQQSGAAGMAAAAAAAAGLLRPHPYLSPLFRNPSATTTTTNTKSSDSDSGASSADPEDEIRSSSAMSYLKPSPSPSSERDYYASPKKASDPSARKRTPVEDAVHLVPRWTPPARADPTVWRQFWQNSPATPIAAAPAPDQVEPIDLSLKTASSEDGSDDRELSIDVGVEEPVKSVPLDLTLDRQIADVGN